MRDTERVKDQQKELKMPLTITEALAEIKTIGKRVEKKRESLMGYLARQDGVRDPLEKDGGSAAFITAERQAIGDLTARVIALRRGIQKANDTTTVTVGDRSRSISEWLTWRRDVAPGERGFLAALRNGVNQVRAQAQKSGASVVQPGGVAERPTDLVVNISEQDLAKQIEALEETLGTLDGQLSLKNATVIIEE